MRSIDDDLRERFAELREADRESMPEFRVPPGAVASNTVRAWRRAWTWAAAAAVLVVAAGAGLRWKNRSAAADPVVTISSWHSPTASLMRTSMSDAFAQSSTLGSVLDGLSYRGY
jgi:hypothetical protein